MKSCNHDFKSMMEETQMTTNMRVIEETLQGGFYKRPRGMSTCTGCLGGKLLQISSIFPLSPAVVKCVRCDGTGWFKQCQIRDDKKRRCTLPKGHVGEFGQQHFNGKEPFGDAVAIRQKAKKAKV